MAKPSLPALIGAAFLAFFCVANPAAARCDLALALAIDVSGSVDPAEYRLQMDGLAAALRDPTVSDALVGAQAAVTVIQWTGASRQAVVVPWRRTRSRGDLLALADEVEAAPRMWRHFSTGIGEALTFSATQFDAVTDCRRRVIDVSGDGRSNEGAAPEDVAAGLIAYGFTVNGLAIEGSEEDLTGYYRHHVIAGPGAFVMTAASFEDYPETIRRKLLTEVATPVSEHAPRPAGSLRLAKQ
ncbi:MAG: DUF1194 domain-containing protein [Pseudomonadota bacterium]